MRIWYALLVVGVLLMGAGAALLATRPGAAALPAGGGLVRAEGPAKVAAMTPFTLATYNVHNLFDRFDNPYTADESTDPKSAAQLKALAAAIRAVNADVLVLQEVEHGGALRAFVSEHLADVGYTAVVDSPTDDPRGICVAALSRLPVVRVVSHRTVPLRPEGPAVPENRFARDLLRVDVAAGETVVAVFGLHLKSKLDAPGDPQGANWRLAEATRARMIIQEMVRREGVTHFAVVGDLNDTPESQAVGMLMNTTSPGLVDVLAGIPAEKRITFSNSRFQQGIDFILLSPSLAKHMRAESGMILSDRLFEGTSDHRPVRVEFK